MKNVNPSHERPIVCLDPGHNAPNVNRSPVLPAYREGERMWKLYLLQKAAMERRGIEVIGTKSRCDQEVSVTARGRMAKGCDAFESLHSNAEGKCIADHVSAIYFADDDCGDIDGQSKDLAVRLAEDVSAAMPVKQTYRHYYRLSSRDRDGDGKKNDDYYGVLYGAHQVHCPGVIIEHSFHSNLGAAMWLLDDKNLEALAEAKAEAYARWFGLDLPQSYTQEQFVREVQAAIGARVDGRAGRETIRKTPTVSRTRNNKNAAIVKPIQRRLIALGYQPGEVDGSYGAKTKDAVMAFQRDHGRKVDGIITAKQITWQKLLGMK